jgi:hypothetical protein
VVAPAGLQDRIDAAIASVQFIRLDLDSATQINADPDQKPWLYIVKTTSKKLHKNVDVNELLCVFTSNINNML